MRILNEPPQKAIPGIADGSLVGDRVDDERGAIMVSRDHRTQLRFRVVQGFLMFPFNRPVYWHLAPDQQSQLLGHTQHRFVVWIMRQANEIAPQFLCPTQKRPSIVVAPGSARARGSFFMNADSPQED